MIKRILISLWEVLEVVLIAVATVFVIRTFLIQPFLVSGASMEPNFSDHNYLIIDRITYRLRAPERGEVVVFRYPNDPRTFFIKRIIGLPSERVVLRNGVLTAHPPGDGGAAVELREPYLADGAGTTGNFDVRLKDNEYFVLGDNRNFSFDSRNWGAVPREDIVGVVRLRLYPFTAFGAVEAPSYER